MGDADDPAHIRNLLDPQTNHSWYFCVGDPVHGPVERIGVVPPMLMAHSLVLRRVLDVQKSELHEKWDIPVTDITPKAFKNLLKYAYGFNNIKSHSLPHSVELLKIAHRWIMKPMCQDLANHITTILTPINVCLALNDPICLQVKMVELEIARLIKNNTVKVLGSPYLHLICPAGMRYIVLLKSMAVSDYQVWRAVVKWARSKVLREHLPVSSDQLESYIHPKLIVPHIRYSQLCSLNIIDLVEEVLSRHPDAKENIQGISKYHFIPRNTPRSLFVCTESKHTEHLKHEEFEVKIIYNCGSWMDATYMSRSTLTISNSTNNCVELYSVVCTGIRKSSGEVDDLVPSNKALVHKMKYQCKCVVKVIDVSCCEDATESVMAEIRFHEFVEYDEDFHILLSAGSEELTLQPGSEKLTLQPGSEKLTLQPGSEKLTLQPNSSYKIETNFSCPHPLWYTHDIDYVVASQSRDLEVGCGLVNETALWYGSHAKYLLFKTVQK